VSRPAASPSRPPPADPAPAPGVAAALRWLAAGPDRTVVALVRHGEVENPGGIRYGRLPGFPLSPRGRGQIQGAAALLAPFAPMVRRLVASPLERTRETAAILATRLPVAVELDDRLLEAESRFDGRPRRKALGPGALPLLWNPFAPSWAEPFREVGARTAAAIRAAEAGARSGVAVVVGHQSPLWLGILALEDGRPGLSRKLLRTLPPWLRRPRRPAPGAVTLLRFEAGTLIGPRICLDFSV
jgi:broad specificity phosphatase PhoE